MKEYLEGYLRGACSDEEFQKAISFLQGKHGEGAVDEALKEHWGAVAEDQREGMDEKFENVLYRIHHHVNVNEEKEPVIVQLYRKFSKIAAILLLPLVCAFSYLAVSYYTGDKEESMATLHVPYGITSEVVLPDGSKVILNSGSTLEYPISFKGKGERKISLSGEGYFEVASNKLKPFIVETSKIGIKVLGTTFNVKAYSDDPDISVALVEGSVKLIDVVEGRGDDISVLKPGELAILRKKRNMLNVYDNVDINDIISWTDGKIILKNVLIESILRQMARKYNVKFRIDNKKVLDYRITATFIHETLEQFLKIMTTSSPLKYEIIEAQKQKDGSYTQRTIILK